MDASALLLLKQLRELSRHPVEGISAGLIEESNPYAWNVILVGPTDTLYEGGFFKARLDFPKDYPIKPPKMVEMVRGKYGIPIFLFALEIRFGNLASEYREKRGCLYINCKLIDRSIY